jgi:hypothetical protein
MQVDDDIVLKGTNEMVHIAIDACEQHADAHNRNCGFSLEQHFKS